MDERDQIALAIGKAIIENPTYCTVLLIDDVFYEIKGAVSTKTYKSFKRKKPIECRQCSEGLAIL